MKTGMRPRLPLISTLLLQLAVLAGCSADDPMNPSFNLTLDDAKAALKQMKADPQPLERPLLIAGGIYDPGFVVGRLKKRFRSISTDDSEIVAVAFMGCGDFDSCRRRLVDPGMPHSVQKGAP